jgi:23S rRNA pseudouridine1911/1915/1917 synthase
MSRAERIVADAEGFRLDQFLALRRPELSRSHWKALVDGGAVTVDGQQRSADYKLKGGEHITIIHPEAGWADAGAESFEDMVLHEDKDLLVLDKEAGLLMHPLGTSWLQRPEAALAETEPNLAGLLQRARPELGKLWRCGIVHRLDRQTSGVLLVAKTKKAQQKLLEDFKERRVSKLYRAVVRGVPSDKASRVQAPIGRRPGHRKIVVTPFGKQSETSFAVVDSCEDAALVEARPLTGRTHQIRAHLAHLGHPVAGDVEFEAPDAQPRAPRLLLHAYKIELSHPGTGKSVGYRAPLPADIKAFWKKCGAVEPKA